MTGSALAATPSATALGAYFLRLGAVGFGGPAALADCIRRDLVERRGWMTPQEYELGPTIAAACPEPLGYQLAVYCGYVRHGVPGAFVVALTFALVPFVVVKPGPVVITATFVGYVVGRLPGAIAATAGMFLPAVLFTLAAAPWFGRHRNSPRLTGFVRGITAAVVGVLAGIVPLLTASAVTDPAAAAILVAALAAMVLTRLPDTAVVALGAAAGVALAM